MKTKCLLSAMVAMCMMAAEAYASCPEVRRVEASGAQASDHHHVSDPVLPASFGHGAVRCSGKELLDQGFSGGMDEHTKIEYIGEIRAEAIIYSIYFFSHVDSHGSYRILLTENGCGYFGSYSVEDRSIGIV